MSAIAARPAWHHHTPLIKFIGPRSAHPPSPSTQQTVYPPPAQPTTGAKPNSIYYASVRQIPYSFRKKPLSQAEIDTIDFGGATWETKPEKKPKK
ncbi:hypothetical protein HDU76_002742 [Blyttiomyces sp. JEL0837]|nr:hypothetical protein HDU76_002742 [Blyttiomyces sp. JEL0837]